MKPDESNPKSDEASEGNQPTNAPEVPAAVAPQVEPEGGSVRATPSSTVSGDAEPWFEQVDARFVVAERFVGRIVVGVLLGVVIVAFLGWALGLVTTRSSAWLWSIWALSAVVSAVLLASLGWLLHAWPELEHRHLGWRLNGVGLEIKKGIWWKHRITVPRDRVQHTDVEQGPVMRRYGLAKLILHTAGTHAPTIELPGLAMEVAQELKNQLTEVGHRSHG